MAAATENSVYQWGTAAIDAGDNGWGDLTAPHVVGGLPDVTQVVADSSAWDSAAVTSAGSVWIWGRDNSSGQYGDGTTADHAGVPAQVPGLSGIVQVSSWRGVFLAVDTSGQVWQWGGYNSATGPVTPTPTKIPGLSSVKSVALGAAFNGRTDPAAGLALLNNGAVDSVGYGSDGNWSISPVAGLTGISQIAITDNASVLTYAAVAATGDLYIWGDNTYGQLGNGTTTSASSPQLVPGISAVNSVSLGENDVMALDSSGQAWAWGWNHFGELGDGGTVDLHAPQRIPGLTSIATIAAGRLDNYAIDDAGQVFAWGYNTHGSVGNGQSGCSAGASSCTVVSVLTPTQVAGLSGATAISSADDAVVAIAGSSDSGTPTPPSNPSSYKMTAEAIPSDQGQLYDIASFDATLTDAATGAPVTGTFVSWKVTAGPDLGQHGAVVTDGQGTAQIIYSRESSSYTSPLSTDTVVFWYDQPHPNGEPDPDEAQASAAWTFSGPTPSFTCPASGYQTPVALPEVDVTPSVLGATLVKKGLSVEYGNLPLIFTSQAPSGSSLCTTGSGEGLLPVNIKVQSIAGTYSQHVADSHASATLDFIPAALINPPACDFSAVQASKVSVTGSGFNTVWDAPPAANNCLLNERSGATSHGLIARWVNPGFVEHFNLGADQRVFSTGPLTYYVDLETLFGTGAVNFDTMLQQLETYYHLTLISKLPIISPLAIIQDPPSHMTITDPQGRSIGWQPDGSVASAPGAGYFETDDRSIAVIADPTSGAYTVKATGSAGAAFSIDFALIDPTPSAGLPTATTSSATGVLPPGGTTTTSFTADSSGVVTAAAPNVVSAVDGNGQTAAPGQTFKNPLTASLTDAAGKPLAGQYVTFAITSGSGTFNGGATTMSATTNTQGVATSSRVVAGTTTGPLTVTATSGTASAATFLLDVAAASTNKADLSLSFSKVTPVTGGHNVSVSLTVTNHGPGDAAKLATLVSIPKGMQIISAGSGTQLRYGGVLFTQAQLAHGQSAVYTLTLRPDSRVRPSARIVGITFSTTPDPRHLDNIAISPQLVVKNG